VPDRLDELLAQMLGPEARFRSGQREAIEAVTIRNRRVLVVQRTGWGKSLVYWMAIRLRRRRQDSCVNPASGRLARSSLRRVT